MLKISTTTIDEYRKLLTNQDYSEEQLINYISGTSTTTKYMQLGTAFHEILENPSISAKRYLDQANVEFDLGFLSTNNIYFPSEAILPCIDTIDYNYPFEVKTTKHYNILGLDVEVVSKVDQLVGVRVKEFKTSWSYFGSKGWKSFIGDYEESIQWKFYLDAFEIDDVDYHVYLFQEEDMTIKLEDIIKFSFKRYERLTTDIENILTDFLKFIEYRNLENYFLKKDKVIK